MLTLTDIARLRELEGKATKGKWYAKETEIVRSIAETCECGKGDVSGTQTISDYCLTKTDAEFIAELRNLVPDLLDTIERMNEALARIEDHRRFAKEMRKKPCGYKVEWSENRMANIAKSAMLKE